MGPAVPQRQDHLHTGGSGPDHAEGDRAFRILIGKKRQCRLQRLDRCSCRCRGSADCPHIEAEQAVVQRGAFLELELMSGRIQANDLRLDEGHAGTITKLPQIDGNGRRGVDAGDQGWNHAGIEGRPRAIHQHDPPVGAQPWSHGPTLEQQRMAVATARQEQRPGGCHAVARYPLGFACCQAQPSRHMSSRLRWARQPSTCCARSGQACSRGTSPGRRSTTV